MRIIKENNRMVLVVMIIILADIQGKWRCDGCLEDEKNALLEIKAFFNYPDGHFLSSWGLYPDCCNWSDVVCNTITGQVTELNLYYIKIWNSKDRYINASLFLPFQELTYLDIGRNNIVGCIKNEGFERLASLKNLEFLDLSYNNFTNDILSSHSALSALKVLHLRGNKLRGKLNVKELDAWSKLQELDLSENEIDEFVSSAGII
ncbi:receptor-like protein 38 [Ricinus communis]|uniref:receptor-like protein 38 n=1 Tax=Ricinus communis TaxID=3988 RepID=UPI00201B232A|nr:receptor-like protein 38 [Ricinus communis]